ncbi:carboxypeptidase regulatory-like domain-containing protein [Humibacter albus]|uniref:carboxypeptidase regulatory-like domain-containing protein n=1 Tax=Humibacter albus TaxID=427754 RepID=UPI0003B3C62C|nr:carboxypeptidase regulatory-like domain-containing protein [Humibacter albus]
MSLFSPAPRSRGRAALALAAAIGTIAAALVFSPAATAAAPSNTGFTGYTGKDQLRSSGRSIVNDDALAVADGTAPDATGTTYYVDSHDGDDSQDGTSAATAWKSFANVNTKVFQPGDRILLKAGSSWSAQGDAVAKEAYDYTTWDDGVPTDVTEAAPTALLAPEGSGSAADPIVISSYGTGDAPKLEGRGVVNDVLQLTNQQHWDISNLDISNVTDGFDPSTWEPASGKGLLPGEENPLTGDLRGIHIQGSDAGTLAGFVIHHVFVHDVSGVTWSVGNSGLDRSKRTGGILFEGLKGDSQTASQFHDVTIRDNYIADTSFANVIFKQFSGMGTDRYQNRAPGWGDRAMAKASNTGVITEDPDWRPHTDIDISGNYLTNRDTQYGWDSLYLTSVQGATVRDNLIDGAGVSGIEMYYSDNIVVQNNEIADVEQRANAADSNGMDGDRGTSNIVMQGNYVHDSGEGVLLCGFGFGTSVVRYNVIEDVARNYVNPHGDSGLNIIYNNLMYNTRTPSSNNTVGFFNSSGSNSSVLVDKNRHYLYNNVFVNTLASASGAALQADYPGVTFSHNAYYGPGVTAPAQDSDPVTSDPQVTDPAKAITAIEPGSASSPLIAAGAPVDLSQLAPGFHATGDDESSQLPTSVDFFGNALTTPPTIGPASYRPADGKAVVVGVVGDQDGEPVPNARVTYGAASVTTDSAGRYWLEVQAGDYTLTPSADDYADGDSVAVTVTGGQTLDQDLALGTTTITTGTVAGTITAKGKALAGATVTVTQDTKTVGTATTDADGDYSIAPVASGTDYTVSASKTGFQTASQSGVAVKAARTATVDLVLSAVVTQTHYAINETFDDNSPGDFTQTNDGQLVASTDASVGSITVVDDPSRPGNKYLDIAKTSSSSGVLAVHNTSALDLTGTVTLEARIARTSTNTSANQVAMYSYAASGWNASKPASSTDPAATFGFSRGKVITHNVTGSSSVKNVADYTIGQWYTVRNVVDLDTGTFDLYIDDMDTPVLTDQPLRTKVDSLDYFDFFVNASNVGDMLVDYFRVNTGTPVDYDDASLGSLSAQTASGDLVLTPSGDAHSYLGTTNPYDETVTITAASGSPFASTTVDGAPVSSGSPVDVALAQEDDDEAVVTTRIPIVVTAENGAQNTYTVVLTRTNPDQLAQLRDLSLDGLTLDPAFVSDRVGTDKPYNVTTQLGSTTTSVHLHWQLGWGGQRVQVNGEQLPVGATEATVPVQPGANSITVTVDSYPGDSAGYVIDVTRKAVDFSVLTGAIADVDALDPTQFSADSWAPLITARDAGAMVVANASSTQVQVDAASQAIDAAESALAPAVKALSVVPAKEAFAVGAPQTGSAVLRGTLSDGSTVVLAESDVTAVGWSSAEAGSVPVTFTVRAGLTGSGAVAASATAIFVFAPAWNAATTYTANDTAVYQDTLWTASWWSRNQTPGDPTGPWQQVRTAADGTAVWTASRIFTAGDEAIYQGRLYEAAYWTRDQAPGDANGPWELVSTTDDGTVLWTASRIFTAGDIVSYKGALYVAQWWTRDQEPTVANGPWKIVG